MSTDAIKHSVLRCISKDTLTHFPGIARRNGSLLEGLLKSKITSKVKISGPAINLSITTLDGSKQTFLVNFTFAIPRLNGHLNQIGLFVTRCG